MVENKRSIKQLAIIDWAIVLGVIIIVNVLGSMYYTRLDLTTEKRYTLSNTSKKLAKELKEKAYFKLYLAGELSSNFKQLQEEIKDRIYEFREQSNNAIEIEVIDPLNGISKKEMSEVLQDFSQRGMNPVRDIETENADETRIKFLLPSAEIEYKGRTQVINFYDESGQMNVSGSLTTSINAIEYEIANAMRLLIAGKRKRILIVDGNKEMIGPEVGYFAEQLGKNYDLEAVNLNITDPEAGRPFIDRISKNPDSSAFILMNSLANRLKTADLVVVCKPQTDYSPSQLFLLDQYFLNGGKTMWLIDGTNVEMDSFATKSSLVAMPRNLENIKQNLFSYGINVNSDLLQDLNCNKLPISNGQRMDLLNFMYFPLFMQHGDHPITKNLGAVWSQFPGTLSPKPRAGISYTPLLLSSNKTKVVQAPASIEFITSFLQNKRPNYLQTMQDGTRISAILLEGEFNSPFANQSLNNGLKFITKGKSKMIVVADADIMRNQTANGGKVTLPTGYDRYNSVTFANQKFLMNCIDYLIDDNGLIEIRAKEFQLRLLNMPKIKSEKTFWTWFNVALPIAIVLVFGLINFWVRKRKYAK